MFQEESFYWGWMMGSTFSGEGGIEGILFMIVVAILFFVFLFAFVTITKYYGGYVLIAVIVAWIICFIKGNDIIAKGNEEKGTKLKYHIPIGLILILCFGTFFLDPIPSFPSTVTTVKFEQAYESEDSFYFYGSENNQLNKNVVAKSGVSLLEIREPVSDDKTRFIFIPDEYVKEEETKGNKMIIYISSDNPIKSYDKQAIPKECSDLKSNCE